jgi:DegV family protein with EDD domain
MNKFIVSVDSTTLLTNEQKKEHGIISTPLYYTLDGVTKVDEFENENEKIAFYERLRNGGRAKSSMIAPYDFIQKWTPVLKAGHDILHLSISKEVSGCYDSAITAKAELKEKYPDRQIEIWDTTIACFNVSKMAVAAVSMQKKGLSMQEVIEKLDREKYQHNLIFTVDDIGHIHRGGRIGHVKALIGSALRLKPILYVSEKAIIEQLGNARGRKKSFDYIVDVINKCKTDKTTWASISHGGDEATAIKLKAAILEKYKQIKDVEIGILSPVLGLHAGPGSFTLSFFGNNRDFPLHN